MNRTVWADGVAKKLRSISPIFENAIDSVRIGIEAFQRESKYSTHKHAILTVFHAIELLLKEKLYRTNPVLIYKNIDKKVTDDSVTVGFVGAITRLQNIGIELPNDQRAIVEKIQGRRNRIERHRYDHKEVEDAIIIVEALKFIFYFVEFVLDARLEDHIEHKLLVPMKRRVMEYNELQGLAEFRFEEWAKRQRPEWDKEVDDLPEEFEGTSDCPECRQSWLVIVIIRSHFVFVATSPWTPRSVKIADVPTSKTAAAAAS